MRQSSAEAVLPEVEPFQPVNGPKVQPSSENSKAAPAHNALIVIGRGGYTLAVPGAEKMSPPFTEAAVSMVERVANGPLVSIVGDTAAIPSASGKWRSLKSAAGILVVLNLVGAAGIATYHYANRQSHDGIDVVKVQPQQISIEKTRVPLPGEAGAPVVQNSLLDRIETGGPVPPVDTLTPRKVKVKTFKVSGVEKEEDGLAASDAQEIVLASNEIILPRQRPGSPLAAAAAPSSSFIKALQELRNGSRTKPVTIVHIGDSHIASDGFSEGVREGLQAAFGNAGRGAVIPAGTGRYARAGGVKMVTVGTWETESSMSDRGGAYGLSGYRVSSTSRSAKMVLTSLDEAFDWAEVTVLTGPDQGKVTLLAGDKFKTVDAKADSVGSMVVRIETSGKSLSVSPAGGLTTVLNWATGREKPGIRYVNFGIANADAYLPDRWDMKLVRNDLGHLDPDLIVWGYGTSEGLNSSLDLAAYRRQIETVYTAFSAAAPGADWLFVGPPSALARTGKAAGYCNGYTIPVNLGEVRETLHDFAKQNDRLFWDWSVAMGGPCAADEWARATPPLFAGDRVLLTANGYRQSAEALVAHITGQVGQPRVVAAAASGRTQ